jgi:hypothetical protein
MARVIIRFTMSSKRKIAPTEEFASGSAMFLPGITSDCFGNEALGSFQDPGDPNEDDSANKGDDDRANHPSGRPDAQTAEKPAAKPATDDAEKDIHDDAVATTSHDESREPASDKTNNEPINHVVPPLLRCGQEG